jgi:hypothetical protein
MIETKCDFALWLKGIEKKLYLCTSIIVWFTNTYKKQLLD